MERVLCVVSRYRAPWLTDGCKCLKECLSVKVESGDRDLHHREIDCSWRTIKLMKRPARFGGIEGASCTRSI